MNSVIESAYEALDSPFFDLDISEAKSALINISDSSDITLQESEKIVKIIADKLDSEAEIIWGVQIDDSLKNIIKTTIIVKSNKRKTHLDTQHENWLLSHNGPNNNQN